MVKDSKSIDHEWNALVKQLSELFQTENLITLDGIIYLIGIQELGKIKSRFKKDDKINIMHIAICKLLEPYGYYIFERIDPEGWPHYRLLKQLPPMSPEEQVEFIKNAAITYFSKKGIICV